MVQYTNDDAGRGRTGALEALLDAAQDLDIIGDYRTVSGAFRPDDYDQVIGLSWRHQFNNDRSKFKREIRELQEHVTQRIGAKPERPE